MDYYSILGIDPTADDDTIKKAYRKLAFEYHPDKTNGDKIKEEKFKEISAAYSALMDPARKRQFDHQRNHQGASIHDIFNEMFRNFSRKPNSEKFDSMPGSNIEIMQSISIVESYHGCVRNISVPHNIECDSCHGSGAKPNTRIAVCNTCFGNGYFKDPFNIGTRKCPVCKGRRGQPIDPCQKCSGNGSTTEHHNIQVNIPAGITSGNIIKLNGHGEVGNPNGDLLIQMVVTPIPSVKRNGNDALVDVIVPINSMISGAKLVVKTDLRVDIEIEIPPNSQTDESIKCSSRGFKNLSNGSSGDMYLILKPKIPRNVSEKGKKLIEEFIEDCERNNSFA